MSAKTLNGNLKPKGNQSVIVVNTTEYYIEKWLDGTIKPRPHNRGLMGISASKVNAIAENYEPGGVILGFCELEDGSYELYDGETRLTAMALRYKRGQMTKSELNYELTSFVCNKDQADTRYAVQNSGIPHTGMMKLTDRSRALGYIGHQFVEKAGIDLDATFYPIFWDAIYAAKDFSDRPILKGLKAARSMIANKDNGLQDRPNETNAARLNDSIREGTQRGLKYYGQFLDVIECAAKELKNGSNRKVIRSLAKQKGLFTVIMADALHENPILTNLSPELVANNAIRNVNTTVELSKKIAKRSKTLPSDVELLFRSLGIKGKSVEKITKQFCGEVKEK